MIDAFRARRLIWSAMSLMTVRMLPMSSDFRPNPSTAETNTATTSLILAMPSMASRTDRFPSPEILSETSRVTAFIPLAPSSMALVEESISLMDSVVPEPCPSTP